MFPFSCAHSSFLSAVSWPLLAPFRSSQSSQQRPRFRQGSVQAVGPRRRTRCGHTRPLSASRAYLFLRARIAQVRERKKRNKHKQRSGRSPGRAQFRSRSHHSHVRLCVCVSFCHGFLRPCFASPRSVRFRYSSKAIMSAKLLYAISNCSSIDGDATHEGRANMAMSWEDDDE